MAAELAGVGVNNLKLFFYAYGESVLHMQGAVLYLDSSNRKKWDCRRITTNTGLKDIIGMQF